MWGVTFMILLVKSIETSWVEATPFKTSCFRHRSEFSPWSQLLFYVQYSTFTGAFRVLRSFKPACYQELRVQQSAARIFVIYAPPRLHHLQFQDLSQAYPISNPNPLLPYYPFRPSNSLSTAGNHSFTTVNFSRAY